jgi:hypothetical protein
MDFEINEITLQEATNQILLLLDVIGRSERLVDFYFWHRNNEAKTETNVRKAKQYVEMYLKTN